MTAVRMRRPPELDRLGTGHAVVEASAGTGKTYLLEHLVVDLLLRRDVELEQILVVTFTEKATSELVQRVRAKLAELRELGPEHPRARDAEGAPDEACWLIDDRARQKLQRALLSFDRASITTIHGFCQRLLTEHAFLNQRLFDEELVDEEAAFHAAFVEVIRREASVDPEVAPYLQTWLQANRLDKLERTLREVHRRAEAVLPAPLDQGRLEEALLACPPISVEDPQLVPALKKAGLQSARAKSVAGKLAELWEQVEAWRRVPSIPGLLNALDGLHRAWKGSDPAGLPYIAQHVGGAALPALQPYVTLVTTVTPLAAELVHRLLPRVARRLEAGKREAGRHDFQDMIDLVARGLDGDGPRQRALLATLRARFRHAIIDEFQDTDDLQWSIFRRIFVDGAGEHVLTVIGDPKQAIYGFRGADVQTYLRACGDLAGGGGPVYLTDNFRSTERLIRAYNAILDQGATPPFFRPEGKILYDHPVGAGRRDTELLDERGHEVAPVMLLDVRSENKLLTWQVKRALLARMVDEVRALLTDGSRLRLRAGEEERRPGASDIYVLTRTTGESREVGNALRAARIPFAYFKQEKLLDTVEAREVLDLLRAIAEPDDRTARARAWITAFFGLSLPELAACEDLPPGHPLLRLLYDWRGLADLGDLDTMLARIVEDSGLVCRELFLHDSERSLTNYLHVLELLQEEVGRSRATIRELVQILGAYINGTRKPPGLNSGVQRLETDRAAVQIMTIHQAKGLEADVVFLYGGLWDPPYKDVRSFHDRQGRRVARVGRVPADEDRQSKDERDDDERRVLYVALTRARGRLYLPRYPITFNRRGCYRLLNLRLHELLDGFASAETRELFQVAPIPCPIPAPLLPAPASGLESWQPPAALLAPDPASPELQRLAETRAGFAVTSYSAVKRRHGGFTAADAASDDPAANEPGADAAATVAASLPPDELPRGRLSGSFLHDVLESVPLEGLKDGPSFEDWRVQPEVSTLFETMRRRHDRRPAHLPHAERLVYTALTAPVRLGQTVIPGLGTAPQVVREMEFLYPIPEADQPLLGAGSGGGRWHIERGVVKGFVDLLFEHGGRAYVCDWKGDWLPSWETGAVAAHAERNYAIQARLYTLAVLRLLKIDSEAAHRERFGGVLYCFLRGMRADDAGAGVHFHCPSWQEVLGWQRAMLGDGFWGLG
jgi:exodeoxyribonuclease V beta subunit